MEKMREDRNREPKSVLKWNKKFTYPKSQRSTILGKRHYDIRHDDTIRNPVGGEATGVSELESTGWGQAGRLY